jgi:hypothetical protein
VITSAKGEALLSFKLSTLPYQLQALQAKSAYFSVDNFLAKADQQASASLVAASTTSCLILAIIANKTYFSTIAFSFSSLTSVTSA